MEAIQTPWYQIDISYSEDSTTETAIVKVVGNDTVLKSFTSTIGKAKKMAIRFIGQQNKKLISKIK